MQTRLLIALAVIAVSAILLLGLAFAGVRACLPPALPGDEMWTLQHHLKIAAGYLIHGRSFECFTDNTLGAIMLSVAWVLRPLPLVVLLAAFAWETIGWRLRLAWLRSFGSHVLLAGAPDLVATLPRSYGSRVWLVHGRKERQDAIRHHPFQQIVDVGHRSGLLQKVGLKSAKLIVAASDADAENLALADAAVHERSKADVLVRLERPVSRALFSDDLRTRAAQSQVNVLCLSFSQIAQRVALEKAMPGRFIDTRTNARHFVVAGEGPDLLEMAEVIARQGYGVEHAPPLLSVLALDASLSLHPTLERLQDARAAVRVVVHYAEAQDREAIDQAMLRILQDPTPVTALHCTGVKRGEASGLALRWERWMLARRMIVPPIVVLDDVETLGTTGMIRMASAPGLSECRSVSARLDQHAKAAHEAYIAGRRKARGAEFGSLPAEREWADLPERFRDDNRAFADHIDYKLAVAGLAVGKDTGAPPPDLLQHARLAQIEHARWMSARVVDRWRYGETRDDDNRIHPDIRPFAELDQDAKQKDADVIASLQTVLRDCGETLFEEVTVDLGDATTRGAADIAAHLGKLDAWRQGHPNAIPVLRIRINEKTDLEVATQVLNAGHAVEIVLDARTFPGSVLVNDPVMATTLREARRIRVMSGEADAPPNRKLKTLMRLEDVEG